MRSAGLLGPVVALVLWTLAVLGWMVATRLPAMRAARLGPDAAKHTRDLSVLPSQVRQVADNYAHLHEQPTLFYAVALAGAVLGVDDVLALSLAWLYVALRIAHSVVQNTFNVVSVRFYVFAACVLALTALTIRVLIALL